MAPFPGCHRVQCSVMRVLFTIYKTKQRKKKRIIKRSLISVCLKNSAWNEWLDVKLCTYLYLFAFIYIWFFTLLISHIDHIKYSKYVCCSKKKKGNKFEWHVTTCVSHFNIKHLTIILIPIVMTLFEQQMEISFQRLFMMK